MSVDERQRHQLYNRAVEVLGEEEAEILMAHLPPGGYPNLATKQDILLLRRDLDALGNQIEARVDRGLRRVVMWNASILIAGIGVATAVARSLP